MIIGRWEKIYKFASAEVVKVTEVGHLRMLMGHRRRERRRRQRMLLRRRRFSVLFGLHAAVLEPDFDLPLAQRQRVGDFDAAPPGQVAVEVELLFQLQRLLPRVRLPRPLRRRP